VADALVFVKDTFTRVGAGGWATPDVGTVWTHTGTASRWNVSGTEGTVDLNGGNGFFARQEILQADTESVLTFRGDKPPTGGGQSLSLISRSIAGVGDYRAMVRINGTGTVSVWLNRTIGTTTTTLTSGVVPNLTYAVGDALTVRFQVSGSDPTRLRVKVFKAGTPEPTEWFLTTTDTTPSLAAPGGFGLYAYLASNATNAPVRYTLDDLVVGEVITP